jgi:hypothetical protein
MDEITPAYVLAKMQELGIDQKQLIQELGINRSSVHLWLNAKRPMTKPVKAMFYFYLKCKEYVRNTGSRY